MAKVGQPRGTEVAALRGVPYFTSLAATELSRLARSCVVRRLSVGEALFEEGQPCRGLLIIADGRIEIRQISLRGREQVFHTEATAEAM